MKKYVHVVLLLVGAVAVGYLGRGRLPDPIVIALGNIYVISALALPVMAVYDAFRYLTGRPRKVL